MAEYSKPGILDEVGRAVVAFEDALLDMFYGVDTILSEEVPRGETVRLPRDKRTQRGRVKMHPLDDISKHHGRSPELWSGAVAAHFTQRAHRELNALLERIKTEVKSDA